MSCQPKIGDRLYCRGYVHRTSVLAGYSSYVVRTVTPGGAVRVEGRENLFRRVVDRGESHLPGEHRPLGLRSYQPCPPPPDARAKGRDRRLERSEESEEEGSGGDCQDPELERRAAPGRVWSPAVTRSIRIVASPDCRRGRPRFEGTGYTMSQFLAKILAGQTTEQILEDWEELSAADLEIGRRWLQSKIDRAEK